MDRQSLREQLIRRAVHSAVFSMLGLLAFDVMGLVSEARANDESERKANAQQVAPDGKPRPPNVVLILADDLGYGDLGCFGQKLIRTPHLDRLAAQGMRFTQAYAGATVCAPSRCCLMTGLHGGHASIRGNQEVKPEGQIPMPADTFTIAHLMKRAGYDTGLIGKWGLGHPGSNSTPDKMGFDYFFGYNCQRMAHEHYPPTLWRNQEVVQLDGKSYSHDLLTEEALQFIRDHRQRPFFLDLSYTLPHQKLQVPDLAPYEAETWDSNLKTLAAMITRLDRDVGRLMSLLGELNLDTQTLVIFASDNGAAYNDSLFAHSGDLRGRKRDLYEGGIRSPSIARWPDHIPAGDTSTQVWTFWDVMPTLAALTGQVLPTKGDGISILPALLQNQVVEHPPLYFEFHERGFQQAARIKNWKGIRQSSKGPLELYDLERDVAETTNVAATHPEVVAEFEAYFREARVENPLWPIKDKAR
ncbi:MAG: atsA 18 [Schlesneria sp.]|nr:atsA 18 [Schlesneria sp.]